MSARALVALAILLFAFTVLLRGHLDADLRCADAHAVGSARASLRLGGHLLLTQLQAQLPIDAGYVPFFLSLIHI